MLPQHSDTIARTQHEERLRQAAATRGTAPARPATLRRRTGAALIRIGVKLEGGSTLRRPTTSGAR